MGVINFFEQRIEGLTSIPADVKNQGPRKAAADRFDKVWGDGKDAVKSIGRDVR